MSLPIMNVKNTSEQLKETLNCATIITPCYSDIRAIKILMEAERRKQWSIKAYAYQYKCGTRKCDLCLKEKMIIARYDPKKLLNGRTVLVSKCRHRSKFLLSNIK